MFCFLPEGYFYFVDINALPACMLVHQKGAPDLITGGCEPPCGCWDLNLGSSEEQSVLLSAEPSLQPTVGVLYLLSFFF